MTSATPARTVLRAAIAAAAASLLLGLSACGPYPGRRAAEEPAVQRPENNLAFASLYKENCAACHGENGRNGASIALANPVYVALAKDNLRAIIANGVPGHLMPAFAQSAGGMLADRQVDALARGIVQQWGEPHALDGAALPPYATTLAGNIENGQRAFGIFCARCHGAAGEGGRIDAKTGTSSRTETKIGAEAKIGSIVDPSYLALVSDQYLRSVTIAGLPDEGMPDWRTDAGQPMTDQQIADIVAWIGSKRIANPGQPYSTPH